MNEKSNQGLDNIYGSNETINEIALLSNGADVVKIKRRFFFQYAPANLLMQLSSLVSFWEIFSVLKLFRESNNAQ